MREESNGRMGGGGEVPEIIKQGTRNEGGGGKGRRGMEKMKKDGQRQQKG